MQEQFTEEKRSSNQVKAESLFRSKLNRTLALFK